MKYKHARKQNQRIQQITESTLVVGADIAKKTHVARVVDFRGIELGKDCVFGNDHLGLSKLVTWMKELQQCHHKTEIILGIEPTGHYWFPLAEFLNRENVKVAVVNPHHVSKSKELEDNSPTKNDYKDAKVIADLVRGGKYSEPKLPVSVYADLRILMNLREKVMVNFGQVQRRIQNWLDRFFPEYGEVFKDWEGKASLITLSEFPTPSEIVGLGASAIARRWKEDVKRAVGPKRATQLLETATTSIGLTQGLSAAKIELRTLLEQYEMFAKQLEDIMTEVERLLAQIPGTNEMLTIPGVAVVTLAGFLAEVGDLSGYDHGQQIIRLAGFNLKENSSGKKKGKSTITKRGRSRLRALLFRAVMPMVAKNTEFMDEAVRIVKEYFEKKHKITPGIIAGLHTFGSKLNFNPHVHMLVTMGGMKKNGEWKSYDFVPFEMLRKQWQTVVLKLIRRNLIERVKKQVQARLQKAYSKNGEGFYMHAPKQKGNVKVQLGYIGRYIRRPVFAVNRIVEYDGEYVEFCYHDKTDGQEKTERVTVEEFISRLIRHIPDENFKTIRYYGVYSRRIKAHFNMKVSICKN